MNEIYAMLSWYFVLFGTILLIVAGYNAIKRNLGIPAWLIFIGGIVSVVNYVYLQIGRTLPANADGTINQELVERFDFYGELIHMAIPLGHLMVATGVFLIVRNVKT